MRTSGRDVLKVLVRSTAALVCVLALASCSSGNSEAKAANPCGISPTSEEAALVRELLGTENFETKSYRTTSRLVDEFGRALPNLSPDKHIFYTHACEYGTDDARMTFAPGWFLRAAEVPSFPGESTYSLNGARGVTSNSRSTLLVQCDMPGELRAQSQKVWLTSDTSYTFSPSRPDADQGARDRRMTLTYLMAQRIAEALGCENKPLEQPPVVKPLPTP
ncbi:hypothetical protein [Streptomyces sp. NBC_00454]|uniref:hypothetical protein n=1 Tax=Streptomyces sp. NBC_00454 TaxID=2975747 RepID=UPI0030DF373D